LTEQITEQAMTAPDANGKPSLPKRNPPRGMVPLSWLGRSVVIEYRSAGDEAVNTSAKLLDYCGLGVVLNLKGARTIMSWDAIRLIELVER